MKVELKENMLFVVLPGVPQRSAINYHLSSLKFLISSQ